MARFEIAETHTNEKCEYVFSGVLDENAVLPTLQGQPVIQISLAGVVRLNSVGTRLWCDWVRSIPANFHVEVHHCPYIFVNTFNEVFGSCTQNMEIKSIYVPFYSDATGESKEVLFIKNTHFFDNGELKIPTVHDSQQGTMEMDVLEGYFGFAKHDR